MRVLVTGGEGYLGSVLIPKLLANKDIERVYNIDALFFGQNIFDESGKYLLIKERIDNPSVSWYQWFNTLEPDIVIALAAISNDPACELNPSFTKIVNHYSVVGLALECYKHKTKFVFASSASVYGAVNYSCHSWAPTFPISLYAKEKLETERDLWSMADDYWQPTIFRMATLYGPSPRFRLDLAINKMAYDAITKGEITVYGGNQYRPFLNVQVAAEYYADVVTRYINSPEIFGPQYGLIDNLCDFNVTIKELAVAIGNYFGAKINIEEGSLDSRNYRIEPAVFDWQDTRNILNESLDDLRVCVEKLKNPDDSNFYTVKRIGEILANESPVL